MTRALLLLTVIAATSVEAQTCVDYLNEARTTAASINLSNSQLSGALADAAEIWNNCGSGVVPNVVANGTGAITVTVTHSSGQSTRDDGACGDGIGIVEDGRVTEGQIEIWDSWGPNTLGVPTGTDCSEHFAGLIAHELGHVFGLKNARGCDNHLMGGGWQALSSPHEDECAAVDERWTMPGEGGGPGGGEEERDDQCPECTPLVLDLNGDGVHTTSVFTDPVAFDIDGDGDREWVGWTDPATEEAFLWLDLDTNHNVDDGRELFGIATMLPDGSRASDGFEALRAYDLPSAGGNGDGVIDVADAIWGRLRLWVDRNHDGSSQPDETGPIHRYGVEWISLNYTTYESADEKGNVHRLRGSYRRRIVGDGPARYEPMPMHDVFFRTIQ
jgi:hypothetical protein